MSDAGDIQRDTRGEWGGILTLVLVGAGIAAGRPLLVAAAAMPLAFLLAAELGTDPQGDIAVERRFCNSAVRADGAGDVVAPPTTRPDVTETGSATDEADVWFGSPGETVRVETTVQNTGDNPVPDLRIADGVPADVPVVSGSPRSGLSLHPGESVTISYEIELRRGEFEFESPTVRTRDLTGTKMRTWEPAAAGDSEIRCSPGIDRVSLADGRNNHGGTVPADDGGNGVEFYSVREYKPGDPIRSIDWRRYARTRDLATVEFRAERSAEIVCVVDARISQFRQAAGEYPSAITLSTAGTRKLFLELTRADFPTGVVGLHEKQLTAVRPGTDSGTRQQVSELLDAFHESRDTSFISTWVSDGSYTRTRAGDPVETLPGMLSGETQVFLFSSFVDDKPIKIVERLRAFGYDVQVLSPDVTMGDGTVTRLEAIARKNRLASARQAGADVIDWQLDRSLGTVLEEALGEVQSI